MTRSVAQSPCDSWASCSNSYAKKEKWAFLSEHSVELIRSQSESISDNGQCETTERSANRHSCACDNRWVQELLWTDVSQQGSEVPLHSVVYDNASQHPSPYQYCKYNHKLTTASEDTYPANAGRRQIQLCATLRPVFKEAESLTDVTDCTLLSSLLKSIKIKMASWTFIIYGLLLTSRYHTYKQNSKGNTHVCEVEHISDINTCTIRHCVILEVDIAATKPEIIASWVVWEICWLFSRFQRQPVQCRLKVSNCDVCDASLYQKYNSGNCKNGSSYITCHAAAQIEEKFQWLYHSLSNGVKI